MGTARYSKPKRFGPSPIIPDSTPWWLGGIDGTTGGPGDRYRQPEGVKGLGWLTDIKYPSTPEKQLYQDKAYDYHTSWNVNKQAAMAKWLKEQLIKPRAISSLNPLANLSQFLGGASGDAKRNLPSSGQSQGILEAWTGLNNLENILAGRGDKGDVLEVVANMGSKGAKIAGAAVGLPWLFNQVKDNGLPSGKEIKTGVDIASKVGVYLAKAGLKGFVPTVKNKTKDIIKGVELRNK